MEEFFELLLRAVLEVVIELLIKGPGYLILRLFSRESAQRDPDGCLVFLMGVGFWATLGFSFWLFIR